MAELNPLNNNQLTGNPTPAAPQAPPVFQASPSGGVVATLRPGQTSFEGQIRAESDRRSGHTDSNDVLANQEKSELAEVKLQQNAPTTAYLETQEAPAVVAQPQTPPKSVRNYKVGAEKPEKKKINWVVIILVVGLLAIAAFIVRVYILQRRAETPVPEPTVAETTVLNYWGLWEPSATFTKVLKDFEDENPGVSVIYTKKDINGYLQSLQGAISSGNGPDVFRYHASWRPLLESQLSTMPADLMTGSEFDATFYPVASAQLKNSGGQIQGIPLMYDGLALIYNKEIFEEAGVEVPKTWPEFYQTAVALTLRDGDYLLRAGAAMGLADNVDFASDIVMLLALQNGMDAQTYDDDKLNVALNYYASYYTDYNRRVWDESFSDSTTEFARGNVAMIFGPSWLIHDITKINPQLQIGVASVPQLDVANTIEWATYYAEGVSAQVPEQRQLAAWRLLDYLSSPTVLEALYLEQAENRSFGEIYPRRDMADLLAGNAYVQPYLENVDQAIDLPFNDRTYDNAVNQANIEIVKNRLRALTGDEDAPTTSSLSEKISDSLAGFGYGL